jgi:hypothetical protein
MRLPAAFRRTVDYVQRKQARGVVAFQYRFRYVGTGSRNLIVETLLETGKEVPGEVSRLPDITFSQSQPPKVFEQFFPKPKAATPPKETKSWRYSPPRGTSPVPQHWRPY